MNTERSYSVQDARDLFARWENGHATEADLAGGLHALIDALSSPPADDVREALGQIINAALSDDGPYATTDDDRAIADAILAKFEVRPYGTVTDTDVGDVPGFEGTRDDLDGLSIRGGDSS